MMRTVEPVSDEIVVLKIMGEERLLCASLLFIVSYSIYVTFFAFRLKQPIPCFNGRSSCAKEQWPQEGPYEPGYRH